MMICTTLPWLLVTFTFSEALRLDVSSSLTAECGKPVTLHCNISSALRGLSIKHMEWSRSQKYCSVDSEGHLTSNDREGDFYCQYDRGGHLSLHFYKWTPRLFNNSFICKLHSNQGIVHNRTQVETREHWEELRTEKDSSKARCTFRKVCPGGDVEWFQDSQRIVDQSLIVTEKHIDAGSWITINTFVKITNRNQSYNCTLKSSSSGRYLTSALIPPSSFIRSRNAAQRPVWTSLWILSGSVFVKSFL